MNVIDADTKTYIIECENMDLYCGKTNDINRRIKEHLKEKKPHFFGFGDRKNMRQILIIDGDCEKQIKRAGVQFIYLLLITENFKIKNINEVSAS